MGMRPKRFLLIDDDEIFNVIHLEVILQWNRASLVTSFQTAHEALAYLQTGEGRSEPPDVVFLDLRMPELNGFDLLAALTEETVQRLGGTRIVMLSSTVDPRDRERAAQNRLVHGFAPKPLSAATLARFCP